VQRSHRAWIGTGAGSFANDADIVVHITQSSLAPHQSHEQVAESLRRALSDEPDECSSSSTRPTGERTNPW
jgi:hypothetical protein